MAFLCLPLMFISILTHISLTTSQSTSPPPPATILSGDSRYTLLGCYSDLPPNPSSSPTYISPAFTSPQSLTVPLCLDACGPLSYTYVAVTRGSICYCLTNLSPLSVPTQSQECNTRCTGDHETICGGHRFLTLYKSIFPHFLKSNTTISITPTPTLSNTTTSLSSNEGTNGVSTYNTTKLWIGVALGLAGFALLVAGLLSLESMLYKRRQRKKFSDTIPPSPVAGEPFSPNIEADKFEHGTGASELGDTDVGAAGEGLVFDSQQEEDQDRLRRRATFEWWKKGVVPPVKITPPTPEVESFRWI